jgi:hypothetical protein
LGDGDDAAREEAPPPPPAVAPLPRGCRAARLGSATVAGGAGSEAAVGGVRLLRAGAAVAGDHLPTDQQLLRHQWVLPVGTIPLLSLSILSLEHTSGSLVGFNLHYFFLQAKASQVVHHP